MLLWHWAPLGWAGSAGARDNVDDVYRDVKKGSRPLVGVVSLGTTEVLGVGTTLHSYREYSYGIFLVVRREGVDEHGSTALMSDRTAGMYCTIIGVRMFGMRASLHVGLIPMFLEADSPI